MKTNEASSVNVPISTLLSSLTITTASSIQNNIDRKLLLRKKLINNENLAQDDNSQEAQIENYVINAQQKFRIHFFNLF